MSYAENTSVSVTRSRIEIEEMVRRAGATMVAAMHEDARAIVVFTLNDRRIQFNLTLPSVAEFLEYEVRGRTKRRSPEAAAPFCEQACRARWRALYVTIKAKLVSIESGIETFEESFLAHIVVNGAEGSQPLMHYAAKAIAASYSGKPLPPLLGPGS